jgi:hypothetical protein
MLLSWARRHFVAARLPPLKRPVYRGGRHCWRGAAALSLLHIHRPLAGPTLPGLGRANWTANVAQSRHARRQVRPDQEPRLRHRLSGAGAPDDDAARARQARRPQTAGYVTGYRGSPLGGLDYQFQRAASHLAPRNTLFQAAINEDLAATALWGSQQAELRGEGKYDGVFGIWYGKGPGVDRSGDAFRHANFAGTSKFGGVLALMGDDHTAESSTTAHQSEFNFVDVMIPILNPAGVQEIIDYGLYGFAMSRFTGTWVG